MTKQDIQIPEIFESKNGDKLPSIQMIEKEYNEKLNSLKKNKSWVRWLIGGGVIFGSLFLTSLMLSHIISGAIGLGVITLMGVIGYYGYKSIKIYDPIIQKKLKNNAMKKLIEEAQEKKIETLTNYVKYLDDYVKEAKSLRNKVDGLIGKQKEKLTQVNDNEFLQKEYQKMIENLTNTKNSIDLIVTNSLDKKNKFVDLLKISREKYDFIKETQDIVNFLQNSGSVLDETLVDESMNQLEKEFFEISHSIKNLATDIEKEN
jgi:hypothetical protein